MTAKSIDEAKQALLNNVNLDKFEFYDFEVLQEPTKGFLGIGSKDAEVKLMIRTDKLQKGQFLVTEMSKHLGYKVDFEANVDESKQELRFNFTGEEAPKMFKQIGRSVHKMEFLINCIINRKDRESYLKTVFVHDEIVAEEKTDRPRKGRSGKKLSHSDHKGRQRKTHNQASKESNQEIDTTPQSSDSDPSDNSKPYKNSRGRGPRRNGPRTQSRRADYNRDEGDSTDNRRNRRSRNENRTSSAREAYLKNTAQRMAKKVVETQQPIALNPMNSYDRRIIHSTLSEYGNVTTRSNGEDHDRHVIIEYSAE